jgi:nucleotide-binding universal stress UspA family protein
MLSLSRILCAVDFSRSSRVALEDAADLAKRFEAELTLIHVRQPPLPPDEAVLSERARAEADRHEVQGKLDAWRAEAALISQGPVKTVLAHGDAAMEVVTEARNGEYGAVVTGTHSRKGIRHVILGSVAERIVREAPCAVLVSRRKPEAGD